MPKRGSANQGHIKIQQKETASFKEIVHVDLFTRVQKFFQKQKKKSSQMIAVFCPSPKVPRQSAFSLLFRAFSCLLDIYIMCGGCCSQQIGVLRNREKHVYSIFQKQNPVLFLNNILRYQLVPFLCLLILATHFVPCPQKSQNLLPRSNQGSQTSACNFLSKRFMHILKIRMPDIYF